ncbi:aldehyde dehydrogenase (NADP(+)) [Nocardioides sp. NPDC101246]|uniref:aldehyde dehydrogenase (NADP(+)) n=1 Tax=Nocardioides sp. NPDC101246 TaxID=3364336 RepID=UPI00380F70DA
MTIISIDPSTGTEVETVAEETTSSQVDEICRRAAVAAPAYDARGRGFRATLLRAIADELERRRERIVQIGVRETALAEQRLNGELTRTVYQARMFADLVEEGSFLEATIDHAQDTPMGPGPDLRRMLVPLGPVAVFGASNFPLAFSVPGGDTMSALAAGCPVVVKAHSSHPALSQLTYDAMTTAAASVSAPDGLLGLVFGLGGGIDLVTHPAIKAVGFTGSLAGGRALMDAIARRPDPIPFYGELSSVNPIVISPGAVAARADQIAEGLAGSVLGSAGQLCTKPGLVLVPTGRHGDRLVELAGELVGSAPAATLLNGRISEAYDKISSALANGSDARLVAEGQAASGPGYMVSPRLLEISPSSISSGAVEECFGPLTLICRYRPDELTSILDGVPGSLTATVHAEGDESEWTTELSRLLRDKAGRLLYNGYPTGVLVSWAQHHGGPWPAATTSLHTSVGTTAARRFQRPVTWQSAPDIVLPVELRDADPGIPRRIDGVLVPGS